MAAEDYFWDDPDDERINEVTCRHCDESPLTWHHTGVRWVLVDGDGKRHQCKASADDFEDLS